MSQPTERAVFLSYASQDAEAVKKICEALRATGIEVWFDQNELTGGDAWDAKIRKQIKDCALFIPIISANTQARTEGYFRLEWRIADQRTHLMAKGRPFLLPVVIDATRDSEAHVPDSFTEVQWTRLPGGETNAAFCARVQKLLGGETASTGSDVGASLDGARGRGRAAPLQKPSRPWIIPTLLGAITVAVLAIWRPWREKEKPTPPIAPAAVAPANSSEIDRVRARLIPDRWQKGDFEALSPTLDRLILANPEDSDAWALRSIINSLQVARNFDSGTKPLEVGRAAAERALRLSPDSPLGEIALGMHLVAMISRGGDPAASRPHVARGIAALPPDALTRYADLVSLWQGYNAEGTENSAKAWFTAEPTATFPAWILAQLYITQRRTADAEKSAEAAAADRNITGTRALYTLFEAKYYLRANLTAAKEALARVPAEGRAVHRVIHARWLLAMAEQRWDEALQELARVSEPMLYDRTFHGPRSLLAGMAHQRAGRTDAALVQFREAERLLRSELASDADNEELHLVLAVTLACAGRATDARSELALVEPLLKGRASSVYWGALVVSIAQTYGVIGDFGNMALWLRKLFVEPSGFPFTPASLLLDPRFAGKLDAPEIQALLKEFASLDQPKESVPGAPSAPADKSVAVLAFADLSAARDSEYFSDGISDELINVLGRVPGLIVKGRSSSFYFKGTKATAQEKGQKLGVTYLVDGSVRRAGDTVRITAQLIRAATDEVVWSSEPLNRDTKDVFAVQEEIAGLIAKNLSLKLGASSAAATASVNPRAFELYVQARQLWNLRTTDGLSRAEDMLGRALTLEPNFARAHAALGEVWNIRALNSDVIGAFGDRNSPELARIRAKAREALALDPNSAEAHALLGSVLLSAWQNDEAVRELRQAIALNPTYATAHQRLSRVLINDGRMDEGVAELKLAADLDPLSSRILDNYAGALRRAGRFTESLTVAERAVAVQPNNVQGLLAKSRALLALGRTEEAVAVVRGLLADSDFASAQIAVVLASVGRQAEAKAHLSRVKESGYVWFALAALGRRAESVEAFDAPRLTVNQVEDFWFDPSCDLVRDDPRVVQVIAILGLTEAHARAQAWRKAHPPEKPAKQD